MTRTHDEVGDLPRSKSKHAETEADPTGPTPADIAFAVEEAVKAFDGRWKLEILFCLFGGKVRRFSDLERAIPGVSQKMLAQQLRQLESEGMLRRIVHAEVPPKVEYKLTDWGQALCPALDALLKWKDAKPEPGH